MLRKYMEGQKGGKGFGKPVLVFTPKMMGGKEGGKVKKRKSFGLLGSPRKGKIKKQGSFGSFGSFEKEQKDKKKKKKKLKGSPSPLGRVDSAPEGGSALGRDSGGVGGEEEEDEEDEEDMLVGGRGVVMGVGKESLDEEDREQVLELFAQFPMLKDRWEEAQRIKKEEGGEEGDPLAAILSGLVVTSLEATELRNVVYDLYNVYVPVMLFQTAMMQDMTIGDFYIKNIKSGKLLPPSPPPPSSPFANPHQSLPSLLLSNPSPSPSSSRIHPQWTTFHPRNPKLTWNSYPFSSILSKIFKITSFSTDSCFSFSFFSSFCFSSCTKGVERTLISSSNSWGIDLFFFSFFSSFSKSSWVSPVFFFESRSSILFSELKIKRKSQSR